MLLQLDIKNYAIISEVSVHFSDNLNVITGETGAGKSILIGALSLILGVRAERNMLRDHQKKAVIEGTFHLPGQEGIIHFFTDNQLDYAEDTILRREIHPSGKSRSFINDTPVNLTQLSAFGTMLVDLHQQFDTLQLGNTDFQLQVLDLLAGHTDLPEHYRTAYKQYIRLAQRCTAIEEKVQTLSNESDYNRFLLEELEDAGFSENELEDLDSELQIQAHTEDLKRGLEEANYILEEGDAAVTGQLRQVQNQLESIASFHKQVPALIERISSVQIELQDLANELQQIDQAVEYDQERINFIQDRINTGYKLLKKHQLQTTAELLQLQERLQEKLNASEDMEEELLQARKSRDTQRAKVQKLAETLTEGRKHQIRPFIDRLQKRLKRVGMPNARMKVTLEKGRLTLAGQDEVSFLFDANNSGHFQPVRKVASGGELSRLMLCIKSMVAQSMTLPTLIFDEIESGVSGEAARQVGLLLNELAVTHQVICISHQPQVAAKAQTHFQVFKSSKGGSVTSNIRQLGKEERVQIIAGMLSGDQPTEAALANARELIDR